MRKSSVLVLSVCLFILFCLVGCNAGTQANLTNAGVSTARTPQDVFTTNREGDRTSLVTTGIPNSLVVADGTVEDTSGVFKSLATITPDGQLVLNDTGDAALDSLEVEWTLTPEGIPAIQSVKLAGFSRNHSPLASALNERLAPLVDAMKSMSADQRAVLIESVKQISPDAAGALQGIIKVLFPAVP
jgi:hypothetical protein